MKYEKSQGVQDGTFLEERRITHVVDMSGQVHEKILKAFDLYIQVHFEKRKGKDGTDFEVYPLEIFGNLKRKEDGTVDESGWGAAFKIGDFFAQLGVTLELDSNYGIPAEILASAAGKSITVLTFVYGAKKNKDGEVKARYAVWDRVMEPGKGKELKASFMKQVKEGYMKSFKPNAVADLAENLELESQGGPVTPAKGDDDLPF
jgi:hypothetical protein